MSRKVNLQELSVLLSEKAGITKLETEVFLKEYFDTMEAAIVEDRLLKVKKIGTFKLVQVNDRASMDIATGERTIIPAHYKISFIPDAQLSETINEPFAMFESVELPQEEGKEQVEQDEVVEEVEEIEEVEEAEPVIIDDTEEEELQPEPEEVVPEEIIIVEELVEEEQPEEPVIEEPEAVTEEIPVMVKTITNVENREPDDIPMTNNRKKRKKKPNWFALISIILLLAMGAVLLFVYYEDKRLSRDDYFIYPDSTLNRTNTVTRQPREDITTLRTDSVVKETDSLATTPPVEKAVAEEKPKAEEPPKPAPVTPTKEEVRPTQTPTTSSASKTHTLKSGETLRIVAEKELGSRDFWVYIYLKNKDKIKNPNVVSAGTVLAIPDKSEFGGINASNPESIKRARNEAAKVRKQ